MSYYVIGIGGTGAKCVESLVHLCAAGLLPDDTSVTCLFVDPDGPNGSLKRAGRLLQNYNECRLLKLGRTQLFKNELRMTTPDVWSPFRDKPQRLDQFFNYETLRVRNPKAAHLFDVLYTPREQATSLERGFRGHPSIGAAVMAATVTLQGEQPWDKLFDDMRRDIGLGKSVKVVLFGSIFGGTGAAGVPTLARLIADQFNRDDPANRSFSLCSVLMLPYFCFDPVKSETMRVDADTFLLSTQSALEYYHARDERGRESSERDKLKICDAVYLLGEDTLKQMRSSSIGGAQQENEPHLLEMYAGLAALHFLGTPQVVGYPQIARTQCNQTVWADLPGLPDVDLRKRIEQLARFAFAYLVAYHPMLADINETGADYRAPWHVDFFKRRKIDLRESLQRELEQLRVYCTSLLTWLANLEQSRNSGGPTQGHLINLNAFAEVVLENGSKPLVRLKPPAQFDREAFDNLLLPIAKRPNRGLTRLWERMSSASVRDTQADGAGRFVRALYDACNPAT